MKFSTGLLSAVRDLPGSLRDPDSAFPTNFDQPSVAILSGSSREPGGPPSIKHLDYRSTDELRSHLKACDRLEVGFWLTIVVELAADLQAELPDLFRRRHCAMRLVILTPDGRLSGPVSKGDLVMCAGALGWRQILFDRRRPALLADLLKEAQAGDTIVVLQPARVTMRE